MRTCNECFRKIWLLGALAICMGGMCATDMDMDMDMMDMDPAPTPDAYGDGSAGAKVISSDENWNSAADAPDNLQFTSLMIQDGVTLMVPSGTMIRCTESFTNYGTITVLAGAEGGSAGVIDASGPDFSTTAVTPDAGVSTLSAQTGEVGDMNDALLAGAGGVGLSEFETRTLLQPGIKVGGGGAPGGFDTDGSGLSESQGANGGGSLVVLAAGAITNDGAINADGQDGEQSSGNDLGGGGGGGGVVLASMTSISSDGSITAQGGSGEDGDSNNAPSGGGGGGFVRMIAPEIDNAGMTDVSGGTAGSNAANITDDAQRYAGGGGGASAGRGGQGGSIAAGAGPIAPGAAGDGADGFVIMTRTDPTALY